MAHHALHYRYNPLHQDIICAEAAIAALPATVDALGASRAMITCGPTILRACNVVPRVQEALGFRYVGVYAGVAPHAPVETVEEGVAIAKEVQPDVFISVIPTRKPRKSQKHPNPQLSEEQKAANTALSRVRIFSEHAIGGMKRYNILVHTFRNRIEHFEDDVIGICAG